MIPTAKSWSSFNLNLWNKEVYVQKTIKIHFMKQVVLFLTHINDQEVRSRFEKIKKDVWNIADVYIATNRPHLFNKEWWTIISFTESDVSELRGTWVLSTDMDLVRIILKKILKKNLIYSYDYYWLIEYDVLFNGNLEEIFRKVAEDDSDLITTHIKSYEEDLEVEKIFGTSYIFGFWTMMKLWIDGNKNIQRYRSFLQFYRISKKAINKLSEIILHNSWKGHFESLVPTALVYGKMKISQFWGESKFTPKQRKSLFYNSYPADTFLGSFRFRPPILYVNKKWYLFHPVKKIRFYSYLKNIIKYGLAYIRLKVFYSFWDWEWREKKLPPIIWKINKMSINIENAPIWKKIDKFLINLRGSKKI